MNNVPDAKKIVSGAALFQLAPNLHGCGLAPFPWVLKQVVPKLLALQAMQGWLVKSLAIAN
jgi:hypothetical protein